MSDAEPHSDDERSSDTSPSLWSRLRARRSTRWAIDIAIVIAVVLAISAFQSRDLLDSDDPLPPVQLEALDGTTLDIDELEARRTVVYFWATWCGVCDVQAGAISSLHENSGDDLDVISVALQYQNPQQIEDYVDDNDIDFPVYLGTDAVANAFEVDTFPTIYIIDDNLQIRHGLVGYTTRFGIWARQWL